MNDGKKKRSAWQGFAELQEQTVGAAGVGGWIFVACIWVLAWFGGVWVGLAPRDSELSESGDAWRAPSWHVGGLEGASEGAAEGSTDAGWEEPSPSGPPAARFWMRRGEDGVVTVERMGEGDGEGAEPEGSGLMTIHTDLARGDSLILEFHVTAAEEEGATEEGAEGKGADEGEAGAESATETEEADAGAGELAP